MERGRRSLGSNMNKPAALTLVLLGAALVAGLSLVRAAPQGPTAPAQLTPTSARFLPMVMKPAGTPPATATSTATRTATATQTQMPTATATATQTPEPTLPAFRNGNFELGDNGDWTTFSDTKITNTNLPITPHSGEWLAWLGGPNSTLLGLSQSVTLPAGLPVYLHFYNRVQATEPCQFLPDHVALKVNDTQISDQPLCSGFNSADWLEAVFDLSAYAGQTITISFEGIRYDQAIDNSLFLDDFTLEENP
jgi:hypothetical protein